MKKGDTLTIQSEDYVILDVNGKYLVIQLATSVRAGFDTGKEVIWEGEVDGINIKHTPG